MLVKSVKPIVKSAKPTSGEIKAMYEEAKAVTKKVESAPSHPFTEFVRKRLEDIDYELGKDVIHASTKAGLKEISPSVSAAAQQGSFGLAAKDAVAFAYNPLSYKDNEEFLYNAMSETAGEAISQGGSPTAYLARMPLSGIRTHADLPSSWSMSNKPLRVIKSEPLTPSNKRGVEDMIRSVTGGESPEVKEARLREELRLLKEEYANRPSPV
jgi:hypothetical protein